ncbi:MAG: DUF4382 domain-containing protein [Candidatus Marsarchaeota archaeon]|jgi:hypothetical protein|nr:DUF4382 domain-containing protein [Candidatus Marsarchaeota archaeon]
MASLAAYGIVVIAVVVVVALAAWAIVGAGSSSGMRTLAVQLTDPPHVPQGTQALLVTYSSVDVHVSGVNQSGWVVAQGSGTVNLTALVNASETIATAQVETNATVNMVRFNVSSAQIIINGTSYAVSMPNNQVTVAVTGNQKISSNSASSVVVSISPTVNYNSGTGTYIMAPAARAIVVSANSSVEVGTNVGSTVSLGSGLRLRLGLGLGGTGNSSTGGGGSNMTGNGTSTASGEEAIASVGTRISNFLVQGVSYNNMEVSGLMYTLYPVATIVGAATTLRINGTIGYACDNSEYVLTAINSNGTATFAKMQSNSTGGCPV